MATIFSKEIDGVTVSYDTELKNQLGLKADAEAVKKSMGRQAVYTFDVGDGVIAFVKLDKETAEEFGEASALDSEKTLTKLTDTLYFVAEASKSGWSQILSAIKLTFKNEKAIKLDVVNVTAA